MRVCSNVGTKRNYEIDLQLAKLGKVTKGQGMHLCSADGSEAQITHVPVSITIFRYLDTCTHEIMSAVHSSACECGLTVLQDLIGQKMSRKAESSRLYSRWCYCWKVSSQLKWRRKHTIECVKHVKMQHNCMINGSSHAGRGPLRTRRLQQCTYSLWSLTRELPWPKTEVGRFLSDGLENVLSAMSLRMSEPSRFIILLTMTRRSRA